MTTKIGLNGTAVLALAGVAVVAFVAYKAYSNGPKVAKAVGSAINPMDSNNLAYRAVNGLGGAFSGDSNWSLGGSIYDLLHPAPPERINAVEEVQYDPMGNPISSGLGAAQTRYQTQEQSSSGQLQSLPRTLSFGGASAGGTSFKDLVSPDSVNPFRAFPTANWVQ